jgi:uncharacterized protein (DUF983 family)
MFCHIHANAASSPCSKILSAIKNCCRFGSTLRPETSQKYFCINFAGTVIIFNYIMPERFMRGLALMGFSCWLIAAILQCLTHLAIASEDIALANLSPRSMTSPRSVA